MVNTVLKEWHGEPSLDREKVAAFKDWYAKAQGDEDKAGEIDTAAYYEGWKDAMVSVLDALYDKPGEEPE